MSEKRKPKLPKFIYRSVCNVYDFYDSGYGRSGLINLQTTRKPFGTEFRYEYVALYCNDQIERIMLEIEHEVQTSVYYKHIIKKLFKQMKLEVRSYSILRRQHTQVSESEFADLMIEMEDKYKKHIDILVFSISNSLLKDNVTGINNTVLSSLLAMGMLTQVGHCTRDFFVKAIQSRYGIQYTCDSLDYLYMDKFNHHLIKLCNELATKVFGIDDRIYQGKVTEAFNAFIVKILGEGEFKRVIENAGIRCENE